MEKTRCSVSTLAGFICITGCECSRLTCLGGPQGHRVVGFISESHLQPKVEKLILEKFNINNLADVATWVDEVRKKRKEENPWHYTNIVEEQWTFEAARDCPRGHVSPNKFKIVRYFG
jgi:hypothetical protein